MLKISFWNPENHKKNYMNSEKHKKNYIKILEKQSYDLYFKVENNPIGILWIKKLHENLQKHFILETRWTGFNLKRRSKEILLNKIKNCIKIINHSFLNKEYNYYIEPISDDYTTDEHNKVHHHFEILIGQLWSHSNWWKIVFERKDINLLNAIRGLNDLSHEIESFKFNIPTLATTFNESDINKEELPIEVENYFTLNNNFGDVYLHYAQLGKTWIEVISDKDEKIFESNICPLKVISGEFDIDFSDFNFLYYKKFFLYISYNLIKMKKNPFDKKLRLGKVRIAKIILKESKNKIIEQLKDNDQILSISIIDEENMFSKNSILSKEFLPYYDPY